ncbi:mannitol-1-phosphate 5-dehydrogenase, partial [Escherichia coli]
MSDASRGASDSCAQMPDATLARLIMP